MSMSIMKAEDLPIPIVEKTVDESIVVELEPIFEG